MAIYYYDDAICNKISKWIPDNIKMRVLKPEESKKLYELVADETNDKPLTLPFVALSRNLDLELLSTAKQTKSFDGLHIDTKKDKTVQVNVIPINVQYSLDIYTKGYTEGCDFVREFLFKLINNPKIIIDVKYNNTDFRHVANIRVLSNVADTSDIGERIFSGQFTRFTIQFVLQDAFLFSIPYRKNWTFVCEDSAVEVSEDISQSGELEYITTPKVIYTWSPDYSTCLAQVILNDKVAVEEWGTVTRVTDQTPEYIIGQQEYYHFEAHFTKSRFETQKTEQFLLHPGD